MKNDFVGILINGGVGIVPTDTIYGIACSAFKEKALEKIFDLKGRDENKPPVVIVGDISDLERFGIKLSSNAERFIKKYWPGKVSIIFDVSPEFHYLDKNRGLAIRLPNDERVRNFLRKTGPLATSSANTQGFPPAKKIEEARNYFGDKVDFYEDFGELVSAPSTIVKIKGDNIEIIRQGAVDIVL